MTITLQKEIHQKIIEFTLISPKNEIKQLVKYFIDNLTISKEWKELSLSCDTTPLLNFFIHNADTALYSFAIKFLNPTTKNSGPFLLEHANYAKIKENDLRNSLQLDFKIDSFRYKAFLSCQKANRPELLKAYIESGKLDQGAYGNAALEWACENGHEELVAYLLSLEQLSPEDDNARILACNNNHPAIVKLLIQSGKFQPTDYVAKWACGNGYRELLDYLLSHDKIDSKKLNNDLLDFACRHGRKEILEFLITEKQFDPSKIINNLIKLAEKNNDSEMVKFLHQHQ